MQQPTSIVFDLDPGKGVDILACADVAFLLKHLLTRLDLECFAKVSGSKGIQVYVPLNTPVDYSITRTFARTIAELLEKKHPDQIVSEMAKAQRVGKVFIDWSQNADFKTTVGVYSLRAKRSEPFVSVPVTWEELSKAGRARKPDRLYFDPESSLKRLDEVGDLFASVLTLQQSLPDGISDGIKLAPQRAPRSSKALREYANKRDFSKTAEPEPAVPRASGQGARRRFVVQKHAASHLHYDFRVEMHHVLKSWAVPKGLPYGSSDKRLAMATEDHPLEYLDFEGTIPKGQYGGGTVMVWDIGTYELMEGNYYKGNLQLFLEGKKLKGEWLLTKDRAANNKNWWIVKNGSPVTALDATEENTSALTGRTLEQIASDNNAQWHSNRTSIPDLDLDKLPPSSMSFIEPMQPKLTASLPEGEDWQYEVKLDGYRALAIRNGRNADLLSRRNKEMNTRFPAIAEALLSLEDGIILDGEIVAFDKKGHPSFNVLQHHASANQPIVLYAFDLLAYRKRDVRMLPLHKRRELLDTVLANVRDPIRVSAVLKAAPEDLIRAAREHGLEGVVAKRAESKYESGESRGAWLKYKVNRGQELVIGGYRTGGKDRFENLAVGYYDQNRLIFVGKIKNGFTPALKEEIYQRFKGLKSKVCPFTNLPEPKNARRGEALTAEAMKKYRWLRPELVAQIEFTEWTAANHLRHSKFVALRDDKDPRRVVRETAVNG